MPTTACEWVYQKEGLANRILAVVTTHYIHEAMMRESKKFYSSNALGRIFKLPSSTLTKLLSSKKYMEGVELEKYHAEMKQKQMDIPKCKERKQEDVMFQKNQQKNNNKRGPHLR